MTVPIMRWRGPIGPLVTVATVIVILLSEHYLIRVPNPAVICFLAVAFPAYFGGIVAGIVSTGISLGFTAFYFSSPGEVLHFGPDYFARMVVLILTTPALALLIGMLKSRTDRALERERKANQELAPLRAALDQSEVGIVLLDSEMRAQFINRALRRLLQLPDEVADTKPAFVGLMYHARDSYIYAMSSNQADAYISKRFALVRAGDEKPVDIRLASGDVLRCRCKVLADGGRMLTYSNVSDLVQQANIFAELALMDGLTGIHNRRHFITMLEREWKRYQRYGQPLSLLMLEIDHFKTINDQCGHDVGDRVIMHIAEIIRGVCRRDSDVVARIGGEEFAILLPEIDLSDACRVAESLRRAIADRSLPYGERKITMTASIGVAVADDAIVDHAGLMKRADDALYVAKRAGRNRVSHVCMEARPEDKSATAA